MSPTRSRRRWTAPKPSDSDRRMAVRAPLDLPVRLKNAWLSREARAVDVSTSGILVVQNRPASQEADPIHLTVDFALPGEVEPVVAIARPVWSRGPFRAFKFLTVSDVDRLRIAEHVDRRTERTSAGRAPTASAQRLARRLRAW
jgi:hypothetical protein